MTNKFFLLTLLFFLLLNVSQPIRASDLLRLFTTPDERTKLDEALKPRITKSIQKLKPSGPKPPRYITFNGLVKRSQGPSTVWINGKTNNFKQPGFQVKLDNLAQSIVSIHLSDSKKRFLLKPGQTLDTLDGTIKDNFEHSLITEE